MRSNNDMQATFSRGRGWKTSFLRIIHAPDSEDREYSVLRIERSVQRDVRRIRSSLDRAGEIYARRAARDLLLDSERTAAYRADPQQPAVSVIRGPGDRRSGLGSLRFLEEPRPADRARGGRDLFCRGDVAGRQERLALDGALV